MSFEKMYGDKGYKPAYGKAVDDASKWMQEKLVNMDSIVVTAAERAIGVDALPESAKTVAQDAFVEWRDNHLYELSYSQLCNAFFHAAAETGFITAADKT